MVDIYIYIYTSMKSWQRSRFLLGPPSMGCGHKIVLCENMSNVIACSVGGHILREEILQEPYLTGGHVLVGDLF